MVLVQKSCSSGLSVSLVSRLQSPFMVLRGSASESRGHLTKRVWSDLFLHDPCQVFLARVVS